MALRPSMRKQARPVYCAENQMTTVWLACRPNAIFHHPLPSIALNRASMPQCIIGRPSAGHYRMGIMSSMIGLLLRPSSAISPHTSALDNQRRYALILSLRHSWHCGHRARRAILASTLYFDFGRCYDFARRFRGGMHYDFASLGRLNVAAPALVTP